MNTAVTFLILTVAFTGVALLVRVANRTGSRRLRLEQFRMAAPMSGRLFGDDDPDAYRIRHDADAIRTANDTQYGLSATVISKDARRAKRIADGIVAGSASINDFGFTYMAQDLPFGGTKGSGFGRLNGREGLRACTNVKAVLEDRFPIHMPSRLYPTEAGSYELVRGTLRTLYGRGLKGRAAGVRDLATTLSAKLRGKLA